MFTYLINLAYKKKKEEKPLQDTRYHIAPTGEISPQPKSGHFEMKRHSVGQIDFSIRISRRLIYPVYSSHLSQAQRNKSGAK